MAEGRERQRTAPANPDEAVRRITLALEAIAAELRAIRIALKEEPHGVSVPSMATLVDLLRRVTTGR